MIRCKPFLQIKKTAPRSGFHVLATLILLSVVRFDGFGLDDHCRVASGEGAAFGGDGSGDIAGRQSECHGDSRGNGQRQVLDGFHEPLFLGFG